MKQFDVTLAGEITMDMVMYGFPEQLPVEHELLASGMALTLGGSSAITAHNLAALGSKVGFTPQIASDPFTELCLQPLRKAGVDLSKAVGPHHGVGTGITVILQHQATRHALTYSGTISTLRYEDLDLDYLASGRHFHLSSFFLQSGLQPDVPRLLAKMQQAGLTTSMDTNHDPADTWRGPVLDSLKHLNIFMPNERELRGISGESDFEAGVRAISARVPMLVVKRGSQGALVVHEGRRYTAPAVPVEVVDAVGAGDSFNSGFIHAYVNGAGIDECLRFGNLCGAYSTSASGGTQAFSNADGLRKFFDKHGINLERLSRSYDEDAQLLPE